MEASDAVYIHFLSQAMEHCLEMWSRMLRLLQRNRPQLQQNEETAGLLQQAEQGISAALSRHASIRARAHPYATRFMRSSSRRLWVFPTSQEWWNVFVMAVWDDEQWLRHFRMTRETFFEIVDILRPRLQRETTNMRRPVTVEKSLAAALYFLANTVSYRVVAQQFGLGTTTVAEIVVEVCLTIEMELLQKTVVLGDHRKIMDGFEAMGMPHTIGAVDATHIPLVNSEGRWSQHSNRNSTSSVLLQAVSDHSLRFIDVEIGWSGRNHDAFVFRNSKIYTAMDEGKFVPLNPTITVGGVQVAPLILGDGVYPMDRWLMKAYTGTQLSPKEKHFNRIFNECRNVVERAFGHLKMRWQRLSSRMWLSKENIVSVISACVVLHNICEAKGHPVPAENVPRRDPLQHANSQEATEAASSTEDRTRRDAGERVRDALATHMYANRG